LKSLDEQQKKCLECRECCEYVEFPVTMLNMDVIEYFLLRGEQMYINPNNGVLMVRCYHPCVHLTDKGCDIYENRPITCRAFMCNERDKSVKEHKEELCRKSMEDIQRAINDYRKKG